MYANISPVAETYFTVMFQVCLPAFPLLLFVLQTIAVGRFSAEDNVVRKRREWILPARTLKENVDYTQKEYIARIRSDFELDSNIHYSLEGIGANQYPFHVFVVDTKTGLIRVTKVLDREVIDTYNLSGVATYTTGKEAEKKIDIRIKVLDENDNAPVFGFIKPGEVKELSPAGASVMNVIATDADELGNENSQIAYSIITQNPPDDMFSMNRNGTIFVKKPTLDRETQDQYILTVKGQNLNGKPDGKTGTGTVTINVVDVNDNPPTLEKTVYEGSIEENTQGVEVMRFKTQDMDLKGTENWEVVFDIVKGNEAGYFSVKTDPLTNEGILMLDKAVDYEDVKNLELGIAIRNKAPLYDGSMDDTQLGVGFGGGAAGPSDASGLNGASGPSSASGASGELSSQTPAKTYTIKINVKNQPEGPHFDPKVKAIPVLSKGQINTHQVIDTYPAIDGDTGKPAENVKYAKGSDPDNWLTIDPTTAEIRLNKKPDRDSAKFLVNGTYIAKVLCITEDMPAKTATGTIAIQVDGLNDNCPTLTSNIQTLCTTDDAIIVNAVDTDAYPNGPPFDFKIISEGTQGKWQVEHLNDTSVIVRTHETLWPGSYEVEFNVTDEQGKACPEPQKVKIHVCACKAGMSCVFRESQSHAQRKTELGPTGIAMLLLGLLLLLLIPLLLFFCLCGEGALLPDSFTQMPFDTKSHLINYHTECIGENAEVPLLTRPLLLGRNIFGTPMDITSKTDIGGAAAGFEIQNSVTCIDGMNRYSGAANDDREATWGVNQQGSAFYSDFQHVESGVSGGFQDDMALSDTALRQYYTERTSSGHENLKDSLLVYDYEGQGSTAGSVGCCSLLESDNDLQFLDDLGPKFKTLAEVYGGQTIPAKDKQVSTPMPYMSINTQTSVSSLVSIPELPSVPKLQPIIPKTEHTVAKETFERSRVVKESTATVQEEMTTVKQGMTNQGQMLLLQQQQQPVYYTTTPVLQQLQYVVQPQVHNTVLLAEAPTTNLQGMILVNSTEARSTQGLVVQGQTLMSSRQGQLPGMVVMDRTGVQGLSSNLIHSGNQTMMVVQGKVPAGKAPKGGHCNLVQGGTLQTGGISRSPKVLVVGGPISSGGQLDQEEDFSQKSDFSDSQKVLNNIGSTFTSSHSSVIGSSKTTVSKTPTYRKVVVEETKKVL